MDSSTANGGFDRASDVASKHTAADWAKEVSGAPWSALIERARADRLNPQTPVSPEELRQTLDFIRCPLEWGK